MDADLRARTFDSGGPALRDAGEDGLLRRVLALVPPAPPGLAVPAGDDAAVWSPPAGFDVVITQDALVEDVDFRRGWITPYRLGGRLLQVSLSDLAATGALPALCTTTVCAPPSTQIEDLAAIQAGLVAAAVASGCAVAGGDVSALDGPLVLDLTALGTVRRGAALRRDAGAAGDLLAVTGALGEASFGLRVLLDGRLPADAFELRCVDVQLDARARLAEGLALAELGVRCAGDLSDGLLVDARRTAAASGCGAELWLDALPADPRVGTALALGGGEDFELLAAAPPERMERVLAGWPAALAPLTVVGRLVEGSGLVLLDRPGGEAVPPPPVLSRHFG